jgi:hypothetical protein
MKKTLLPGVFCLIIGAVAFSGAHGGARARFAGAWRLAWLEQQDAGGKIRQIDCCGLFVFTRDGHMSVQVMQRSPEAQAQTGPQQYSQGGYEATYGRYAVDEGTHTFTIHVEGSLVRALIGKDLPRLYEFSGRQLIVKPAGRDEHWRVAWERY